MTVMIVGLVLRHLLTFGGGAAVTHGVATGGDVELIVGAITTLGGLLWSAWQKYQANQQDA